MSDLRGTSPHMQLRATTYAGLTVVPDSVNSLNITRSAWRNVAFDAGVQNFEIELVCSDLGTHRERVEARKVDIPGFQLATWKSALERQHEPRELVDLVVDNAKVPVEQAFEEILQHLSSAEPENQLA